MSSTGLQYCKVCAHRSSFVALPEKTQDKQKNIVSFLRKLIILHTWFALWICSKNRFSKVEPPQSLHCSSKSGSCGLLCLPWAGHLRDSTTSHKGDSRTKTLSRHPRKNLQHAVHHSLNLSLTRLHTNKSCGNTQTDLMVHRLMDRLLLLGQ